MIDIINKLTIGCYVLSDDTSTSHRIFFKTNLGDDNTILQNSTTRSASCISSCLIIINIGTATFGARTRHDENSSDDFVRLMSNFFSITAIITKTVGKHSSADRLPTLDLIRPDDRDIPTRQLYHTISHFAYYVLTLHILHPSMTRNGSVRRSLCIIYLGHLRPNVQYGTCHILYRTVCSVC